MYNYPRGIPCLFNRASAEQRTRLFNTLSHFGVKTHHALIGETLLRLDEYISSANVCLLPTDPPTKALLKMYKHFQSLD